MKPQDYVLISEALARSRPYNPEVDFNLYSVEQTWERHQWERCRQQIMDVLARDNPRFDRERFIEATER